MSCALTEQTAASLRAVIDWEGWRAIASTIDRGILHGGLNMAMSDRAEHTLTCLDQLVSTRKGWWDLAVLWHKYLGLTIRTLLRVFPFQVNIPL